MKMNKTIDVRGMIEGVAALIMAITFGCAPIEVSGKWLFYVSRQF